MISQSKVATNERGIVMQKEMISMGQAICMIVLFLFGSSAVMGMSSETGQDSWIAIVMASVFGSMITLIYARIISLFPERNLYDIAQAIFGKIIGKIIIVLMTWYAIHLAALVLRNFSEFIQIVALEETPQLAMMIATLVVTGYLVVSGIGALGKWSMIATALVIAVVLFTVVLAIKQVTLSNILPMMTHDFSTIGSATLKLFTFPFAETVLFLTLADSIKKSDNPYRIYLYGIFIGGVVLVIVALRNLMILGAPMMGKSYFPSYTAARIINIGELFSRIEMSIFYNFILGGIAKISICVFAAVKGVEKLFNIKSNLKTVFFVSILILLVSKFQFNSVMEMMKFIDVYQYYALSFQIFIPVLIWIGAEMKTRKKRKNS
jgi:spore germination protein KB